VGAFYIACEADFSTSIRSKSVFNACIEVLVGFNLAPLPDRMSD
jgi:hypothetical protein